MRVHGASKWQLVKLVLFEGLMLSILGTFLGLLISRMTLLIMSLFVQHKFAFNAVQFNFLTEELWLFPSALLIGLVASLIPTILIYRFNIPKILSNA
jgi:putative ABC transport system permease protein